MRWTIRKLVGTGKLEANKLVITGTYQDHRKKETNREKGTFKLQAICKAAKS